jgi:GAF domain-containing protein
VLHDGLVRVVVPVTDPGDLDLQHSLAELVGLLPPEETFEQTLHRIVLLACRTVVGCESASVTLVEDGRGARTVVHTDDLSIRLDEAQYRLGLGPSLTAARSGEGPVAIPSMRAESRWQPFPREAVTIGAGSLLSLPLAVRDEPTGALNLYSPADDAYTEDSRATATLFAAQAAVAIANARVYEASRRLAEQMEEAMRSRAVIEQAKGILMAERGCDQGTAFDLLRMASQRENVKLREIAQRLVDSKTQAASPGSA